MVLAWLIAFLFWASLAFGAAPTVTTQAGTQVLSFTATGNGNVTNEGGLAVTDRGVVWNFTGTPTTADNKISAGAGATGAFTVPLTGLTPQVRHRARAYAINSGGTSYGSEVDIYPEPDRIFRCYATSTVVALTAFPECHALLGGKSYYITDYHWTRSVIATATEPVSIQSGTTVTTDCDTATATLYSGFSLAFQPTGPGRFSRPLKVTAGHNLCFIQTLAGPPTTKLMLLGFVGSTAQAAEIRTSSAVDFNCVMSSAATALTEITGCAALTGGKSYYITTFNWSSSIISTTANFMLLSSGTGANCASNTTSLYAGFINAAFVPGGPGPFQTPIKVAANHALCFTHASAGTRKLNLQGYIQ